MALPTNANQVQAFAGAMYGVQIGTFTMAQVNNDIISSGGLNKALNSYYAASFGSVPTATVAATVATNLGLTGAALTSGAAYIAGQLNAAAANARGEVIANILNLFAGMASDATFGAAASAWNAKVDAAATYTGSTNVAMGFSVGQAATITLTGEAENITALGIDNTFNSSPISVTVFGMTGFMDSYIGDTLDGGEGNDTLNMVVSSGGAFTSSNIENINITVKPNNLGSSPVELDMTEVKDVENLTAYSLRTATDLFEVQQISALTYKNNLRGEASNLNVEYALEVVAGDDDTLDLTVENNIDGGLVTVNGIETVNITAVGTNVFDLSAVDAEVNISGAANVELDLLADDALTFTNEAAGSVILYAALATSVTNSGSGDLTVVDVADAATVTNSGTGSLSFEDTAAATATITNSSSKDLTVVAVGAGATITNSGSGTLTVTTTGDNADITNSGTGNADITAGADSTIVNSSEGTLTVSGAGAGTAITNSGKGAMSIINSLAASVDSTGAGNVTIGNDVLADEAKITATGTGALTVSLTNNGATIDASTGSGDVTLTINAPSTERTGTVDFTAGSGDALVILGAKGLDVSVKLTGGTGANEIQLVDVSSDDFDFTNVSGFETITYTGTEAVSWDTSGIQAKAETTLVFGAITTTVGTSVDGLDGANGVNAGDVGGLGLTGTDGPDGVTAAEITAYDENQTFVFNTSLSSAGADGNNGPGNGGAGAAGDATTTDGGAGGAGADGAAGGMGASVLTFADATATVLNITLNGVTLDSSGGDGGDGGVGGAGGAGFNVVDAGDGGDGGAGGAGGNGGLAGLAAVTIDAQAATAALTINIASNKSADGTVTANKLVALGGTGGAGGAGGFGGKGGLTSVAGATNGDNGVAGAAGSNGSSASPAPIAGLAVADTATVNITGDADFSIGLLSGADLTVDASALSGDLTVTTEDGDDTIIGGRGVNTIGLMGGVDTVDLTLSEGIVDAVYILGVTGTDITDATKGVATITGFDLSSDELVINGAVAVANTKFELTASDLVAGVTDYSVYQYKVTAGVFDFGKSSTALAVSTATDAEFQDGIHIVFTDVLKAVNKSVAYFDGTDSWLFVSDATTGYQADSDTVIKLVGVEVTNITQVLG